MIQVPAAKTLYFHTGPQGWLPAFDQGAGLFCLSEGRNRGMPKDGLPLSSAFQLHRQRLSFISLPPETRMIDRATPLPLSVLPLFALTSARQVGRALATSLLLTVNHIPGASRGFLSAALVGGLFRVLA